jgi:thermitase
MRKYIIGLITIGLILLVGRESIFAQISPVLAPSGLPTPDKKAEQMVVIFKGKPAIKTMLNLSQGNPDVKPAYGLNAGNSVVYAVTEGKLKETLENVRQNPNVFAVFPNYKMHLLGLTNDPSIIATPEAGKPRLQWNMFNIKAAGDGKTAWDVTTGSSNVVVAIIDSGVDSAHPDLTGKFSSLVDCVESCKEILSMTDNAAVPHGTHVAGIVAAATNNSVGIAGVGYNTKIMMIKVMNASGEMTISNVINGIKWAADHNAKVINMSLGQYEENLDKEAIDAMNEAVNYAWGKGAVVVAAAGNCGSSTNGREDCAIVDAEGNTIGYVNNSKSYPGALQNVISVAALKVDNTLPAYSQRNDAGNQKIGNWITIAAPGGNCASQADSYNCILSTFYSQSGKYGYMAGTSQATPHVAGVAALIFAANSQLSNSQVRSILETTGDKSIAAGATNNGALDAFAAVSKASENISPTPSGGQPSPTPTGSSVTPTATPALSPSATPISTPSATLVPVTPSPTLFPTASPRLPKTPPDPYPPGPYCPKTSDCSLKGKGDANCDGYTNKADYKIFLEEFDTMVPPEPVNQNANFYCQEDNPFSYFVDLVDYEILRRYIGSGGLSPVPLKK